MSHACATRPGVSRREVNVPGEGMLLPSGNNPKRSKTGRMLYTHRKATPDMNVLHTVV